MFFKKKLSVTEKYMIFKNVFEKLISVSDKKFKPVRKQTAVLLHYSLREVVVQQQRLDTRGDGAML